MYLFQLRSVEIYRLFLLIELLTVASSINKASAAACAARSAAGRKSLESFTGESPLRQKALLAAVARISPPVRRGSAFVLNWATIRNPN